MRACFLILISAAATTLIADDWPHWMGPGRDNVWRETGILKEFPDGGPKVLWRSSIAGGFSGPAVANGKVFVTDFVKDEVAGSKKVAGTERVFCLDEATGKELWRHENSVVYTISYSAGPRCTPAVDGDRVYTLGAEGHLICLDIPTGVVRWQCELQKLYGAKAPIWGYAAHPLIDGDRIITLAGGKGSHVVALNKMTGDEIWRSTTATSQGYSPPTIIEYAGVRQLILLRPDAMSSVNPKTGVEYWSVPYKASNGSIIMSPVVSDGYIYAAGFNKQSLMVQLASDTPSAVELWRGKRNVICPVNVQPFCHDGTVYGFDQKGVMRALKWPEGDRLWESTDVLPGRPKDSQTAFIVKHEDRFWLFNERGEFIIAQLSPDGFSEIDRVKVIDESTLIYGRDVVWCMPAFANRHAYLRNEKEIICVDLSE